MKGRKILGVMLLIISLALIGSGTFLMINGNKIRFVNAIKKYTKNIVEDANDFKNVFVFDDYDATKVNSKISTVNTINILGEKFTISGDMYSKANSKTDGYYDMVVGIGKDTVKLDVLLKQSKAYFKVKDVLAKYYYTDFDLLTTTSDLTMEDLGVLKDYFLDSTFKVLAKNKIVNEKVELNLAGTTYKLDKLTVDINEETLHAILVDFMKRVNEDAKYRDMINSSMTDGTTLEDEIKEFEKETDFSEENVLTYSIYVDSKENIYRHELIVKPGTASMIIDSYKDKEGRKHFLFDFIDEGKSVVSLSIDSIDANQSVITGKIAGEPVIAGTYSRTDTKIELELSIKEEGVDVLKAVYTFECKEKGKSYSMILSIDAMGMVGLESVNTIELGVEYPNIDVSGAAKVEEISEQELMALQMILMGLAEGFDAIGGMAESI